MARARNIKPGFFQHDLLGELPPLARLLFIGLWTIADFKGCLEYRPARIKVQILPYDECDIESLANYLDKSGFISIYSVQGKRYIKIVNFGKHQTPHKNEREAGSECPDIDKKDSEIKAIKNIEINLEQDGTTHADSLFPLPSSLIPESTEKHLSPDVEQDDDLLPEDKNKAIPFAKIVDAYNLALPSLPAVKRLNAQRKSRMRTLWLDRMSAGKYCGIDDGLIYWQRYFNSANKSDFLMGRIEGNNSWVCSFDFLLSEKGFNGVIEGKYTNSEERKS